MESIRPTSSSPATKVDTISTARPPVSGRSQLTPEAFETCRQILIKAFGACDDTEFQHISCIISCVLTAVRRLHVSELQGGAAIYSEAQYGSNFTSRMTRSEFTIFIKRHLFLFRIEQDETVTFGHWGIPAFLRNYRIRGVDVSNRTIAMICQAQIQACRYYNFQRHYPEHTFALLNYAEQFCSYHCQMAMRTSLSLNFDRPESKAGNDWVDRFAAMQVEDDWVYIESQ